MGVIDGVSLVRGGVGARWCDVACLIDSDLCRVDD